MRREDRAPAAPLPHSHSRPNTVFRAFVFGLTIGVAIGPIALLILNFAITSGWQAGVLASLGSTAADFIYALLAFGAGRLLAPVLGAHRSLFNIVAGCALVAIGFGIVAGGVRYLRGRPSVAARAGRRGPLLTGFALTLVNPLTIVGFAAFGAQLHLERSWIAVVSCAVAAVAGTFSVSACMAVAGGALQPLFRNVRAVGWLNVASGAAVTTFGIVGALK